MHLSVLVLVLVWVSPFQGTEAAQWSSSSPPDGDTVYACSGDRLTLAWGYVLGSGEVLGDIQWFYDGTSQEMVATSVRGNFFAVPAFANRVEPVGNAGIILAKVLPTDSGNYGVEVHVYRDSGAHSVLRRSVHLEVESGQPMTQDGSLHARQSDQMELDPSTDRWAIQLQCGHFTYSGQPPFQVEWITPSGQNVPSFNYSDGHFNLLLTPPLQGGNYTCRISPNATCDQGSGPREATVSLDMVLARFSLLEQENKRLTERLAETNAELNWAKTELNQTTSDLWSRIQTLERAPAFPQQVGFHAQSLRSGQFPTGSPLIFSYIRYNLGNAYNSSTGFFTAPVNGLYFFIGTTATEGTNSYEQHNLIMEGNRISHGYSFEARGSVELFSPSTVHAVVHLTAGQRVWVGSGWDNHNYNPSYSSFSGALLSPSF